jgi:hypothetical protein
LRAVLLALRYLFLERRVDLLPLERHDILRPFLTYFALESHPVDRLVATLDVRNPEVHILNDFNIL